MQFAPTNAIPNNRCHFYLAKSLIQTCCIYFVTLLELSHRRIIGKLCWQQLGNLRLDGKQLRDQRDALYNNMDPDCGEQHCRPTTEYRPPLTDTIRPGIPEHAILSPFVRASKWIFIKMGCVQVLLKCYINSWKIIIFTRLNGHILFKNIYSDIGISRKGFGVHEPHSDIFKEIMINYL